MTVPTGWVFCDESEAEAFYNDGTCDKLPSGWNPREGIHSLEPNGNKIVDGHLCIHTGYGEWYRVLFGELADYGFYAIKREMSRSAVQRS